MDGEALVTVIGFVQLITKVGLRIKVYKLIKSMYNGDGVSKALLYSVQPCVILELL